MKKAAIACDAVQTTRVRCLTEVQHSNFSIFTPKAS